LITVDISGREDYVEEVVELAPCVQVPRKWAEIKHPDEFQLMKVVSRITQNEKRLTFVGLGGDVVKEGKELARLRWWHSSQS
jgi:hypothetical protein